MNAYTTEISFLKFLDNFTWPLIQLAADVILELSVFDKNISIFCLVFRESL